MNIAESAHAVVQIPEWEGGLRHHLAGCQRLPLEDSIGRARIAEYAKDAPKVDVKFIQDIKGGIRTGHIHLGDQVVLLDRERFKRYVGDVASTLAQRRVGREDYIGVMQAVGDLLQDDPSPEPFEPEAHLEIGEFIWKGEITYEGTAAGFNRLMTGVKNCEASASISEWKKILRPHLAGCQRTPLRGLLGPERLTAYAEEGFQVELNFIQDIDGGMRTGHFHLADKQVVLLDPGTFKRFVGDVARATAELRAARLDDYIAVSSRVQELDSTERLEDSNPLPA